jgi:hypothetical protein
VIDDRPRSRHLFSLSRTINPGSSTHNQQLRRLGFGEFRKNPFGSVRSVEDNKGDR